MRTIKKLTTDKPELLFIGSDGHEEYYQDTTEKGGWSFMGLRPETEVNLRGRMRETDPADFCDIPEFVKRYFDYEAFADDLEEDWYNHHDVQAEREEGGETLYLGFGSGQSIDSYFGKHNIKTYEDYVDHFEFVGLTEVEFKKLQSDYELI